MMEQGATRALSEAAAAMPLFSLNSRSLSASDIGIANYIAQNPSEVQTLTISELAARTEVSEATISRFCRKIGLNGVQSLKLALAGSQAGADADIASGKITKSDDCRSLMRKVFSNIVRGLGSTEEVLDPDAVEKAAAGDVENRRITVKTLVNQGIAVVENPVDNVNNFL